jgi:hypothetical protein
MLVGFLVLLFSLGPGITADTMASKRGTAVLCKARRSISFCGSVHGVSSLGGCCRSSPCPVPSLRNAPSDLSTARDWSGLHLRQLMLVENYSMRTPKIRLGATPGEVVAILLE